MAIQLQNVKIKGTNINIDPYVRITWSSLANGIRNEVSLEFYENKQAWIDKKMQVDVEMLKYHSVICDQNIIAIHDAIQEIVGGEIVDLI